MKVYRFSNDETTNDDAHILLKGDLTYAKMKILMDRTWYPNHEEKVLGVDKLLSMTKYKK